MILKVLNLASGDTVHLKLEKGQLREANGHTNTMFSGVLVENY